MCIQNMKSALLGIAITLFSFNAAHAQIEKGTTSLGGNASFSVSRFSSLNSSKSTSIGVGISPSYGLFVTDKIMVKGRLTSALGSIRSDVQNNNYNKIKNQLANIEAEVRYYFNPKSNWKFFGGGALGWTQGKYQYNQFLNNQLTSQANIDISKPSYALFGGVNKFLNDEIALEGTLSYSNTIDAIPLRGLGFNGTIHSVGLNIGLNNFTNYKKIDKNFDGLIDKGQSVINGNIALGAYSQKYTESSLTSKGQFAKIDLEYGRFVAKGLLIGSKANFIFEKYNKTYSVSPYAQYYYPVSKRLMLHAKAELGAAINQNNSTYLSVKGGIGATYFLSKHVAISFDALNFTKNWYKSNNGGSSNSFNFTPQIGLRFFF